MATIFSRIIAGEIPSHKIAEDDRFFAFLDINPVGIGHTLVVPKAETDYIFDIDDQQLGEMMVFAKKIARAIGKAIPCKRVGVTVIGLEVPHAHIHLVPLHDGNSMDFKHKISPSHQELAATAELIRAELA